MRIEGMDATLTKIPTGQDNAAEIINTKDAPIKTEGAEINIQHLKKHEKAELPVSEKAVIEAIEKANKAISTSNRVLEFSIHEKTKEIMVKVVDSETKEVIREIPPEKVLDMVARLWEMAGILVDERR
ncbi:MAG: flagellar protein FlaG [Clostridiaceae bacterium]|nr:flagellar protein FlaG [Clostridiaceae bacterium]